MIWLAFALLTCLALFSILWPLSRPAPKPREDAADVAFYRAQIAEIDAELARGAVDARQAEAAKAEAARRLLAAAPAEVAREESARTRKIAAALSLLLVPAMTLAIYSLVGHPDQPDMPLEARLKQPPADMDIATAVAKIEAHIAAHPEDGRAYEVVAPVYLRMGKTDAAVHAREEALRLLGETPERLTKYAVALTYAADGVVSPDAEIQLDRALKIDPKFMEARYFVGLAAAQHDERERAREIWTAMLAELPANSPIRREVVEKIAMLDAPVEGAPPPAAAPSEAAAAAVAAQPADQQQKTINAMVERLAQRLATQGGGADEWMRLIRAYKVLNEVDKSQGALAEARQALKDDAAAQGKLAALAQELGLGEK
jgi:cytochrome c-type biogenesis protein CcmH